MRISENSRKTLYIILGILLLSVCSLTIVYAALNAVLRISGNSEIVASTWDIHLENPEVKSGSVSSNSPSISGTSSVGFSVALNKPGDFYEFTVDVVNDGTIDAMIDSVVKTPNLTEAQAKYIKYEITYENGESINTNQTLKKGTSTPIKVRVEYRKDLVASDLPSGATELNLKLILIYVQSDGSGSEINNNGVAKYRVVSGDINTVGSEVCIGNECFYVVERSGENVYLFAKYNLNIGNIVQEDGTVSPLVSYTGMQDKNSKGRSFANNGVVYPIVGAINFSSNNYWQTITSYPADVYSSMTAMHRYMEDYRMYFINNKNIVIYSATLITYEQLENLGCDSDGGTCLGAPEWVYTSSYWTASAANANALWTVYEKGDFHSTEYNLNTDLGVRPVLFTTISELE